VASALIYVSWICNFNNSIFKSQIKWFYLLVIFFDALGDMFSVYVGSCWAILEPAEKRCLGRGAIIKQGFGKSQVSKWNF